MFIPYPLSLLVFWFIVVVRNYIENIFILMLIALFFFVVKLKLQQIKECNQYRQWKEHAFMFSLYSTAITGYCILKLEVLVLKSQ